MAATNFKLSSSSRTTKTHSNHHPNHRLFTPSPPNTISLRSHSGPKPLTFSFTKNNNHSRKLPVLLFSGGDGGIIDGGNNHNGGSGGGDGGDFGNGGDRDDSGDQNKEEAIFALTQIGRSLESLPKDLATAIENGRIPGSIVSRYLEVEKSPLMRWLLQFGGFKERLLADDLFLAKIGIKCGVGVFIKAFEKYAVRFQCGEKREKPNGDNHKLCEVLFL